MVDYGKRIAELRKNANLTQAELGRQLNVTSQAVSKWENGLSEPDLDTISKLCSILNVSINDFFCEDQEKNNFENEKADGEYDNKEEDVKETECENLSEEGVATKETSDELNNVDDSSKDEKENLPDENGGVKIEEGKAPQFVYGYCDKCKKMITTKDYEVVSGRGGQKIYCRKCSDAMKREREESARQQIITSRNRGLLWGGISGVASIIMLMIIFHNPLWCIFTNIVLGYGVFALVSQMFWSDTVQDCMFFFMKSFRMPGVIFTLDLHGIIWFITVKLLLGVLSFLLSAGVFLFGVFVTYLYAFVAFPFTIVHLQKQI